MSDSRSATKEQNAEDQAKRRVDKAIVAIEPKEVTSVAAVHQAEDEATRRFKSATKESLDEKAKGRLTAENMSDTRSATKEVFVQQKAEYKAKSRVDEAIVAIETKVTSVAAVLRAEEEAGSALEISHDQNKRDLKRELLSVYQDGEHMNTSLGPVATDEETHIDELYVTPNMKDDRKPVKDYQDIFKPKNKQIYVVGEAGTGKTSLCQNMVSTWYQTKTKQIENMSDNQQAMAKFDYLFYISLRNVITDDTIDEMIKHDLLPNKPSLHEPLSRVLDEEKCLIILDGLDEWTTENKTAKSSQVNKGLPGKDAVKNCTVLTTTRPWKLESLKLKSTQIDTKVELLGIDAIYSNQLIQNMITHLNEKFHKQKKYEDFITDTHDKELDKLTSIPVILKQIVCLWHGGKHLGKNKTAIYCQMLEQLLELAKNRLDKDPQYLEKKEEWKKMSFKLPFCFDDNETCQDFIPLIIALSELAFLTSLSDDQESSLVFKSSREGCHNLSSAEVNICLKIGILSKDKILIDCTSRYTKIFFMHKSYQEFLAAIFVSLKPKQCVETFKSFCNTDNKCQEMSNILTFISGTCTSATTCTLVQHYNDNREYIPISDNIIDCMREGWACSHDDKHLYCDYIDIREPSDYLDQLCKVNIYNIKTLVIHSPPSAQCLQYLLQIQILDRLAILSRTLPHISEDILYDLVHHNRHTLTSITVEGLTLRSNTKLSTILHQVQLLNYASLYGVTMTQELRDRLKALHSDTENRRVIVTQATILPDTEGLPDVEAMVGSTTDLLNTAGRNTTIAAEITSLPVISTDSDVKKEKAHSLPAEILRMDRQSIELYKQILTEGEEAVHTIRVMVVGQFDVGKTALTQRLLKKRVDIDTRDSTDGIEVHTRRCKVSLEDGDWTVLEEDDKSENTFERLAKLIAKPELNKHSGEQPELHMQDDNIERESDIDGIPINTQDVTQREGKTQTSDVDNENIQPKVSDDLYIVQDNSTSMKPPVTMESDTDHHDTETIEMNEDTIIEHIKGVIDANNLKDTHSDYADLSIWDFAGQYAFYSTHQVFLSNRAVYLLVTDISKPLHDVVEEDKCYSDSTGSKLCTISEFIEFWLNSIHEYCPNQEPGVPPVILVGTHADKLDQSKKEELSDQYFDGLRMMLKDNVTLTHLVDADFAIDNAIEDPNLTKLKDKIFEVASKQQYWGELIPARWITLEQALVELRVKGVKICDRKMLLMINKTLPVPLPSDEEMDLFLRFHHDSGNILYFGNYDIYDNILLDPQWLVDAFKCLITADMFLKKKPTQYKLWHEFNTTGKLKQELIDVVWKDTEFIDHRDHLIRLLEQLDIIARPRSFITDDMRTKIDDFCFAPCALKHPPPTDIFQPNTSTTVISTSRLCFSMKNKALPVSMFTKLMAACLTKWPVSKQGKKDLIFCGCVVFEVDRQHHLTLFFSQDVIQIWVTKFAEKEPEPNENVCTEVRTFIEATLAKIVKQLPAKNDLKQSFKCPQLTNERSKVEMFDLEVVLNSAEVLCHQHDQTHVLSSADMLKYWNFEDDISGQEKEFRTTSKVSQPVTNDTKGVKVTRHRDIDKSKVLRAMCKHYGRTSPEVIKACDRIRMEILVCSMSFKDVWPTYKPTEPDNVVFVVFREPESDRNIELPLSVRGYDIEYRTIGEYSNEDNEIPTENQLFSVTEETDRKELTDILHKSSSHFMKKHSNLNIITASPVKSNVFHSEKYYNKCNPCVVFYVCLKGFIPIQEEEFPRHLGSHETDVREGAFELYNDPEPNMLPLKIGCSIGGNHKTGLFCRAAGTLGAFVDLKNGTVGCISSAHVLLGHILFGSKHLKMNFDEIANSDEGTIHEPSPKLEDSHEPFGRVKTVVYKIGGKGETGVEAGLISIENPTRYPDDGRFPTIPKGLSQENQFNFMSGKLIKSSEEFEDFLILNKKVSFYKYGAITKLTEGYLILDAGAVRTSTMLEKGKLELHNQIEICPKEKSKPFAEPGDSGALVLASPDDDKHDLHAIGILTGGNKKKTICYVTPIWEVLNALKLPLRLKNFNEPTEKENNDNANASLSSEIDSMKISITEIKTYVATKVDSLEVKVDNLGSELKTEMNANLQAIIDLLRPPHT